MGTNHPQPTETVNRAAVGETARPAAAVGPEAVPEAVGRVRGRLASVWRFGRHLLEMIAAMVVGMAVLRVAIGALGEPPGYDSALVEYGLMGASMSAPMVAWMRHRGHAWSDGLEMTGAMLVPMLALVLPVELGVVGLTGHPLMTLSHMAMIGGMAALMV